MFVEKDQPIEKEEIMEYRNTKKCVTISIVVCTMNRPNDLKECLRSIENQNYFPHEVIIVDASHDNSSKEIVRNYITNNPFNVQYIKTNPGLTRQRNIGIAKATGDIIGFLDDDVILEKMYLYEIASCFEDYSSIYGATGNILNLPKRKTSESLYYKIFMFNRNSNVGSITKAGFPNFISGQASNRNRFTRILSGCNMFYRKNVFEDFLFDEYFEGYSLMEDAEFSYRISQKYKLMYVSDAKLVHHHSPSQRINLKRYFEMTVLNHNYVFKKLIKKSNLDWLFYLWSNVGVLFIGLYWTIKEKNINPMIGLMRGFRKITSA